MIHLTTELISVPAAPSKGSGSVSTSSSSRGLGQKSTEETENEVDRDWKVGDKCMALWEEDNQ